MRHSKIDLTMNVYTDPRLLDVSGALDALPTLSLTTDSAVTPEQVTVTGTDDGDCFQLAPLLAPGSVQSVHFESTPVTLGKIDESSVKDSVDAQNRDLPTKKACFPMNGEQPFERPRRDLNPQPPDRQSGALTN